MPKKPTGRIGSDRMSISESGASREQKLVLFPGKKEEIEALIVALFIDEGKKHGFKFRGVKQNPENHFDYTLELPGGQVYLDLAEVVYRDSQGNPYKAPNHKVFVTKFAEQIRDLVLKKSSHYGKLSSVPIHLLLYVTHWRFAPDEKVIRLAQHFLKQRLHIIENVFLLIPKKPDEAELRVLYPSRNPLKGNHPIAFANDWYVHGDLDDAVFDPTTGTVKMTFPT